MGKIIDINKIGEKIKATLNLNDKKAWLAKNIILEIFLICSVWAPWYTNMWWCFAAYNPPAPGTFFNTVCFFIAVWAYSYFADKWWNIPCMIYMLTLLVSSIGGMMTHDNGFVGTLDFLTAPPAWGLMFIPAVNDGGFLYHILKVLLSLPALYLCARKYFRKKR